MMGWKADAVLDAVERRFAPDYFMLRETVAINVEGRIDAILIPFSNKAHPMMQTAREKKPCGLINPDYANNYLPYYERCRIIGIEVKVLKSDFKKGLETGQFDRYSKKFGGLYIATSPGVCQTKNIPEEMGHIYCFNIESAKKVDAVQGQPFKHLVIKRHPTYRVQQYSEEEYWRLMFSIMLKTRDRELAVAKRYRAKLETLCDILKKQDKFDIELLKALNYDIRKISKIGWI